ncbi:hypothetical protein ASD55_11785 [Rhodanobacter sp. Root561]|nr:hypothetical protein ASD55_11785 [Rhodanobacter sp. Root561]
MLNCLLITSVVRIGALPVATFQNVLWCGEMDVMNFWAEILPEVHDLAWLTHSIEKPIIDLRGPLDSGDSYVSYYPNEISFLVEPIAEVL